MAGTGGRQATSAVIPGRYALSVGKPDKSSPKGWRWVPLTSVARLETGHTPSRRHPEYWGGDVPWIGIKDATSHHGRVVEDTVEHTNDLGLSNSSARLLPEHTVCLSRTASVGYVVVMGRPMATSQDFVNWVCGPELDYRFLKHVLLAEGDSYRQFSSGTTHQTIYFPEVKAFHICLPPIKEQRAMAAILGAFDDKIESNRRMSETLEAMARALFKSWFVDFDPVRAKAGGASSPTDEVSRLFPQRLIESDIGAVPEGWVVRPVSDLAEVVGGTTPRTNEPAYWDGGTHCFATPKDLSTLTTPVLRRTERCISDLGLSQIGSGLLPPGTVLMSSRAPVGYLAIADVPVAINQGFIAMKPRPGVPAQFLLRWAASAQDEILSRANGSTFLEISKANFRPIQVVVPPDPVMRAYQDLADPLYQRVVLFEAENETLTAARGGLLPRLISGEMRVPDAERIAAEVGV